jgi:hypothetical protein
VADSERYQSDSDGYQSDSDGYQSDRDGYQDQPESSTSPRWQTDAHPKFREIVDREIPKRGREWERECVRQWEYFASLADAEYGDQIFAVHLFGEGLLESDRWPPPRRAPDPELPRVKPPSGGNHSRDALTYQVNVRLREGDYVRLAEVACRYGLPATTMARLFIARGAEAAAREHSESGTGEGA